MADSKMTALTELTAVAGGDILHVVDDPSGTPVNKKVTLTNLITSIVTGKTSTGTLAETDYVRVITTPGTTPVDKGITLANLRTEILYRFIEYGFISQTGASAGTQTAYSSTPTTWNQFDTKGPTNACSASPSAGTLTMTNAGIYLVFAQLSFSGTASSSWTYTIQLDGVDKIAGQRKLNVNNDIGSASVMALVTASTPGTWSVELQPVGDSKDILTPESQFGIVRIAAI